MAVQSGEPLQFWGWADEGEKISIKQNGSVLGETVGHGKETPWRLKLPAQKPGPVGDLEITGTQTITLTDIVAGEVWLCSGQSNMVMTLQKGPWCGYGGVVDAEKEIAAATDSNIRVFNGKIWMVSSPENAPQFSGTAYFFARQLRSELKVPVGVLVSASGGTAAELWTPPSALKDDAQFAALTAKATAIRDEFGERFASDQTAVAAWKKQVEEARSKGEKPPSTPLSSLTPEQAFAVSDSAPVLKVGALYSSKIQPLAPFNIKGAVWYQGESNARRGEFYTALMASLIKGWRQDWDRSFPFVIVGLAGFGKPEPWTPNQGSYALLREAQIRTAETVQGVGVISALDLGQPSNIHPPNKQDVGRRAALWALHHVYSKQTIVPEGPKFPQVIFTNGKASVHFKDHADGLVLKASDGFELAGDDHKFVAANATLRNNAIEVSAPGVDAPVALRYAFQNFPVNSVYNGAGLPALPFRTDNWPLGPEAK